MKNFLMTSSLLVCMLPVLSFGQDSAIDSQEPAIEALDLSLTVSSEFDVDENLLSDSEIIEKLEVIRDTLQVKEILPVEGVLTVDEPVMFLETLKFEDGAVLELTAGNHERIFLLAKEVRLNGPDLKATIRYADIDPVNGTNAADRTGSPAKIGGRSGSPSTGSKGQDGIAGEGGEIRKLPTLWIVADDLQIRKSPDAPFAFPDVRINVDGIDGGQGGAGGDGQKGGEGQNGRNGDTNFGVCSQGAKAGGNGGRGGAFGAGGVGGDGGRGGDILFIVSSDFAEHVKDMRIVARGGLPGRGGINGNAGLGGDQGNRGSAPGTCDVPRGGGDGSAGTSALHNSRANDGGSEGDRGRIRFVPYDEVASLFD